LGKIRIKNFGHENFKTNENIKDIGCSDCTLGKIRNKNFGHEDFKTNEKGNKINLDISSV
jgi:hypothetical protein